MSELITPIVLTPGEPAGIGPDLILQLAAQSPALPVVVIADISLLKERAQRLNLSVDLVLYEAGKPLHTAAATLNVLHVPLASACVPGQLNVANASYVLTTLRIAAEGCLQKQFAALVTGPVHKANIQASGIPFSGHTEFFAQLANIPDVVMMLVAHDLRVALVTTHLPLSQVPAAITAERLEKTLRIIDREFSAHFHIQQSRILVCGLNPHAGEGGHLGREEIEVITPVLNQLRKNGMQLQGPLSADTIFTEKYRQQADVIVAMYHDQGLPVLKHYGFGHAVNVTLGLPFIRTSVDHGTALDLAGTTRADVGSLKMALATAISFL